jgi:Ca2+-binding EF-hand superfamily protein
VQVHDIVNKYDNGSSQLSYPEFRRILHQKMKEADSETNYKESFRVFSKGTVLHTTAIGGRGGGVK